MSISNDGTLVAFTSSSTNLIVGKEINGQQLYVKNLISDEVTLISEAKLHWDYSTPEENNYVPIPAGEGPKGGNGYSSNDFSHDNRYIAFESSADNLLNDPKSDTNNSVDIFIKDLKTGDLKLVSQLPS